MAGVREQGAAEGWKITPAEESLNIVRLWETGKMQKLCKGDHEDFCKKILSHTRKRFEENHYPYHCHTPRW